MSHFKAKMLQIRFPASIRPSVRPPLRWRLTQRIASKPSIVPCEQKCLQQAPVSSFGGVTPR